MTASRLRPLDAFGPWKAPPMQNSSLTRFRADDDRITWTGGGCLPEAFIGCKVMDVATIVLSYSHISRSRIDLPITQSLSSSDRNGNSSVK
jgi:hypothetical protein